MKKLFFKSLDRQIRSNPWSQQATTGTSGGESLFDNDYDEAPRNRPVSKYEGKKAAPAEPSPSRAPSTGFGAPTVPPGAAATNEPMVTVSVDSFLKVLEQHNKQQKWLQQFALRATAAMTNVDAQEPYIINKIKVTGEELSYVGSEQKKEKVQDDDDNVQKKHTGACFTIDFEVDVLDNVIVRYQQELWRKRFGSTMSKRWKRRYWTKVSLLERICNNISLKKCLIRRQRKEQEEEEVENENKSGTTRQEEEEDNEEQESSSVNDNLDDLSCHIGIQDNSIVMLCGEPGLYHVQLVVDVSINQTTRSASTATKSAWAPSSMNTQTDDSSTSPRSISLYFASEAVKNELDFKIHNDQVQVKVSPSLHVQKKRVNDEQNDRKLTQITCSYPSTRCLTIDWTPKIKVQSIPLLMPNVVQIEEETSDKKVQLPLTVTSQQNTLHAIGEGLVRTTAVLDYSIVNGSLNQLEIMIDPYGAPFKVLNVTGGTSIRDWNVYDQKELSSEGDETLLDDAEQLNKQQQNHSKKILKIQFKYGVERSLNLRINSELEMGGTSAKVFTPSFTSQNVTRETGTIAVVARTNVEIREEGRKFLRKIDSTELPSVQRQTPFPILHSYRFLERGHELHLNVTRHDDVEVLCACIETCVYDITLSSGKLLHKLKMYIRNTAKQYLRVRLDKNAEIWSTTIDNTSVKPSSESQKDTKLILIPLNKKDACRTMLVEFVFTVPSDKLEGRGTFKLDMAKFDSPINVLNLSLFLPKDFNFSEFDGNIQEVTYFSTHVPDARDVTDIKDEINQSIDRILSRGERLESLQEQSEQLQDSAKQFYRKASGGGKLSGFLSSVSQTAGLKPVNLGSIDSTTGMKQFKFERFLLLENQGLRLSVDYKEIKKGLFERRSTQGSKKKYYVSALLILVLAYVMYWWFVTRANVKIQTE